MLRFATKADLWNATNAEARRRIEPSPLAWRFDRALRALDERRPEVEQLIRAAWDDADRAFYHALKTSQDGVALERLGELCGKVIGEIGGGNARILSLYAADNECFNIDRFDGSEAGGQGPDRIPDTPGVTPIVGYVGTPLNWPAATFDVLFSISVVEHVPTDALAAFFDDCQRLLRPGGRMLHLIDMYLVDGVMPYNTQRMSEYASVFGRGFSPVGEVTEDTRFSCSYLTNPDASMAQWQRIAPGLAHLRPNAQDCTLILDAKKRPQPEG